MANGGFIAKKAEWIGTGVKDTANADTILEACKTAFLSAGNGWWSLDTRPDFAGKLSFNTDNTDSYSTGYYFVSQSGAQLVMVSSMARCPFNEAYTFKGYGDSYSGYPKGICIAMIPPNTDTTWTTNDWTAVNWLPKEGLFPMSNMMSGKWTASYVPVSCNSNANVTYRWTFAVKQDAIIHFFAASDWTRSGGWYAWGRGLIYGDVCVPYFEEDILPQSTYGGFILQGLDGDMNEKAQAASYDLVRKSAIASVMSAPTSFTARITNGCGGNSSQCFNVAGNLCLCGGEGYPYEITGRDSNIYQYFGGMLFPMCEKDSSLSNLSSYERFGNLALNMTITAPFCIGLNIGTSKTMKDRPAIKDGIAFKGFIKSDVMVVTAFPKSSGDDPGNITFDDHKYLYIGGGTSVGWDSSNNFNPFTF